MDTKEGFLKYKDRMVKAERTYAIAGILGIVSILIFIFAPIFKIQGEEIRELFRFSLFDDVCLRVKMCLKDSSAFISSIYIIIGFIYLVIGLFIFSSDIIKTIVKLKDINGYALVEYDNIINKHESNEKTAKKIHYRNNIEYGFLLIILIVFIERVILTDIMPSFFSIELEYFGEEVDYLLSYLSFFNGITFFGFLDIAMFVSYLVLKIVANSSKEKIRLSVVKDRFDDYLNKGKQKS